MRGKESLRGKEPLRREAALTRILHAAAASLGLAVVGCGSEGPSPPVTQVEADGGSAAGFVDAHWRHPVRARPPAASGRHPSHDDLRPASCGSCHAVQYEDWRSSLHSRAMGPGVAGQLKSMDDAERRECQRCHAPLDDQLDATSPLHAEGLVCAACHMREGRVLGPPRRDGTAFAGSAAMPHGGWQASDAFEDSRFCAACHQFEANGFGLNGKLLENTYEEWKSSRHAREGRACQSCHMPDRRHLWRGIHDSRMTRAGVTIEPHAPKVDRQANLSGGWRLVNSGTGHFFPTYVTPRIVATIRQETSAGRVLAGTATEHVIARQVARDLTEELSDTRIAPDEARELRYALKRHPAATHLALEIRVEPDAFYTELYRSLLRDERGQAARKLIQKALQQSVAARYTLHTDRQAIPLSVGAGNSR